MKINEGSKFSKVVGGSISMQTLRTVEQNLEIKANIYDQNQQSHDQQLNIKKNYVCRICLEPQKNAKQIFKSQNQQTSRIIELPCSCKSDLGRVHEKCVKYWIKIWLQQKINNRRDQNNNRQQRNIQHRNRQYELNQNNNVENQNITTRNSYMGSSMRNEFFQNQQNNLNQANSIMQSSSNVINQSPGRYLHKNIQGITKNGEEQIIKPLIIDNLKQKVVYPFPCQVCQDSIYFDLLFHRRLTSCMKIKKKEIVLFGFILLFTLFFLGICANWFVKSGISLPALLFYVLFWVPLFFIAVAVGVGVFTNQQFWVRGIYSRSQVYRRHNLRNIGLKKNLNQKQVKNLNNMNIHKTKIINEEEVKNQYPIHHKPFQNNNIAKILPSTIINTKRKQEPENDQENPQNKIQHQDQEKKSCEIELDSQIEQNKNQQVDKNEVEIQIDIQQQQQYKQEKGVQNKKQLRKQDKQKQNEIQ